MTKSISRILFYSFLILMLWACSSKQDPIDDLEDFTCELETNSENYSQKDWDEAAQKYQDIEEELQQYDYDDEELKEIGKLKARCAKAMICSSAKTLKTMIHDFSKEMEGAAEEMQSSFEEMEDIFDEDSIDEDF